MRIIGKYERSTVQAVSGHAIESPNKDIAPVYGSRMLRIASPDVDRGWSLW